MKYLYFWLALGQAALLLLLQRPSFWTVFIYLLTAFRIYRLGEKKLWYAFLLAQIFCLGFYCLYVLGHRSFLEEGRSILYLEVPVDRIQIDGNQISFRARVVRGGRPREWVQCFYTLTSEEEQELWANQIYRFRVEVKGEVVTPQSNRNLGLFNYQSYLKDQGIDWQCNIDHVSGFERVHGIAGQLPSLKRLALRRLDAFPDQKVRGYLGVLFFRDWQGLPEEDQGTFDTLGLTYLLTLSGFQVQFIIRLLKRLFLSHGLLVEKFEYLVILVLLLYGSFLGWPYSMWRVISMSFIRWLMGKRGKTYEALNAFGLSMGLILLVRPGALFQLGFQLTYAITLILHLLRPYLNRLSQPVQTLAFSGVCCLVALPFLVGKEGSFSWGSWLFGPLFSRYLTSCLFPLLFIVLVLYYMGFLQLFSFLVPLTRWSIEGMVWVMEGIGKLPFLRWTVGRQPWWLLLLLTFILLYFFDHLGKKGMKRGTLLLLLSLLLLGGNQHLKPFGEVVMVDIGQGDCFYLEMPFQSGTYLIDCAGRVDFSNQEGWARHQTASTAERLILPTLQAEGVTHLDGLFLTHGDYDHYGSVSEILPAIEVETLYLPIGMREDNETLGIINEALKKSKNPDIQVVWIQAGDKVSLDRHHALYVLAPDKVGEGTNEDSLVCYGQFGHSGFLFTGDVVGEAEKVSNQLLEELGWSVDVLKVSHHGSDHSTPNSMIDAFHPKVALISVGKHNRYGHPSSRIIEKLEQEGVKIYRTDQDGGVYYIFSPFGGYFQTTHDPPKKMKGRNLQ